jgi:hypothetical protein
VGGGGVPAVVNDEVPDQFVEGDCGFVDDTEYTLRPMTRQWYLVPGSSAPDGICQVTVGAELEIHPDVVM